MGLAYCTQSESELVATHNSVRCGTSNERCNVKRFYGMQCMRISTSPPDFHSFACPFLAFNREMMICGLEALFVNPTMILPKKGRKCWENFVGPRTKLLSLGFCDPWKKTGSKRCSYRFVGNHFDQITYQTSIYHLLYCIINCCWLFFFAGFDRVGFGCSIWCWSSTRSSNFQSEEFVFSSIVIQIDHAFASLRC